MDANAASLSFTSATPQHLEVTTSPDAVKVQRRESFPFTPAAGQKNRTNTGPSSVWTDVPAIVQTSVGRTRAASGDQGDTAPAATNENVALETVAPETVAQDVAAGTDGKPVKAGKNGHSRKPSIFDKLSFKWSKSTVEARQAGANNQGPTPSTEQGGLVLASNINELTAKALQPEATLMLVKAEEMEAAPLDAENRPPLEGGKEQKKGKSGRFLACISPRTKDD
ncbi:MULTISPECIES: hypothetical protein [unclassified Achromobacter]|uniref:hypothetical protein n=1 Tax=unclassified Achromobacter TaxID=2626865 RepID=UPI000B51D925|nr:MULTISPECIES: hypothetical protein [unclassified Achromobacter]OWT76861.1 hypothetical protein CEY04_12655 [Achromobacter sp. HZ28]OWT77741.1 hypothetical protein CEY05_07150 [Achromobacter sp. HZ34]